MLKLPDKYFMPATYVLALLMPFVGFVLANFKIWDKRYHPILIFFGFWFGFTVFQYSGDITRYQLSFERMVDYTWNDFSYYLTHFYTQDKFLHLTPHTAIQKPDLFAACSEFFVSRFTSNSQWFFAWVSAVYVFLITRFINEVILYIGKQNNLMWFVLLWFIILTIPFYVGVTGVRFWNALFFFMWQMLAYFRTKKNRYLFFAVFSALFHYSFIIPSISLFLFVKLFPQGKLIQLSLVIIGLAFFVFSSGSSTIQQLSEASEQVESEEAAVASGYVDPEKFEEKQEKAASRNWYVSLRSDAIFYLLAFIATLDYLGVLKWKANRISKEMLQVIALFFVLALCTYNLGSIGRFKNVFYLLYGVRLLDLVFHNKTKWSFRLTTMILALAITFITVVNCRGGFYFIDPLLIIGNPIILLTQTSDISLSEWIVGH